MGTTPTDSGISIDWKPILLWGGGTGALLGLWAGLWTTGFIAAWDQGWLHPGIELPAEYAEYVRTPTEVSLAWLARVSGLPPSDGLGSLLLWGTAFGAAVGAIVASVGRLLRLDPDMVALRSFVWSLRACTTPMVVAISLAMTGLVGVAFAFESSLYDGWFGWVALGILVVVWLLVWLLGIPVLVCREDIAGMPHAPRWWRPTWPGWIPVLIVFGIEALDYVPSWLLSLIDTDSGMPPRATATATVFDLALGVMLFVGPLVQCVVLMGLGGSMLGHWKRIFRWSTLGPWIALHGWWTLPLLLGLPPVAAVYVWVWKVVPVLASIHESVLEEGLPYLYQIVVNAFHLIGTYWWAILFIPLAFFFWFGTARFVSLLRSNGNAGLAPPPAIASGSPRQPEPVTSQPTPPPHT